PHGVASYAYHGDRTRAGAYDGERDLAPERVRVGMRELWVTPALDTATVGGIEYAPHFYASPLYVDDVAITAGEFAGARASVVVAASSNGFVYAIGATRMPSPRGVVAPGTILWKASLGEASQPARNLDGVPFGVLSTPFIDLTASPPRVYVTCAD